MQSLRNDLRCYLCLNNGDELKKIAQCCHFVLNEAAVTLELKLRIISSTAPVQDVWLSCHLRYYPVFC